jgi:hypothetical protein
MPKTKLILSGTAIVLCYVLPYVLFGQNSHISIHDILEDNSWIGKVLLSNNPEYIFSPLGTLVPNVMDGIPRASLGSELSIPLLLHYFFNSFTAYVISQIIIRLVAFYGMYYLLLRHYLHDGDELILVGVALAFSFLPFWSPGFLSIAGQPLLFYAFMNIRSNSSSITDWIIIIVFPLGSIFVYSGLFIIGAIIVLTIYSTVITRKVNFNLIIAVMLFACANILVDYRLFYQQIIDSSYISHRVEFSTHILDIYHSLTRIVDIFLYGGISAKSLNKYMVLLAVLFASKIVLRNEIGIYKLFPILLVTLISISIIAGLWRWEFIKLIMGKVYILKVLQWDRIYWMSPMIWYIIFALSLHIIANKYMSKGRVFALVLIVLQLIYMSSKHELLFRTNDPSYKEFYAEKQFSDIINFIGKDVNEYRIVSLGMHPAITQYNGMHTLDGYFTNYPLAYKHQFRKIISGELEKNNDIKAYYDNWGSRCYILSAELGRNRKSFLCTKDKPRKVSKIDIDFDSFKKLGGEYIISAAEIDTPKDSGLTLLNEFDHPESAWHIWLYSPVDLIDCDTLSIRSGNI